MDQTAPRSASTEPPASPQESRSSTAMPACIAAILSVVRTLLGYGKHLDETLPDRAAQPGFPALAAGFGTHDLRRILSHVQRGILRAMMLRQYLLARAAQGRDIEPSEPPVPAEQADIEAMEIKLRPPSQPRKAPRRAPSTDPNDPLNFSMPTLRELESQVRRRSIGRTITEICMDLGIAPSSCEAGFWHEIYQTLTYFGGKFEYFFEVQERRREAFKKERDKLPNTWTSDWQDRPKEAIRQLLGYLIGESPPRGPPIPQLLTAAP
jgi:hypothetical protein